MVIVEYTTRTNFRKNICLIIIVIFRIDPKLNKSFDPFDFKSKVNTVQQAMHNNAAAPTNNGRLNGTAGGRDVSKHDQLIRNYKNLNNFAERDFATN